MKTETGWLSDVLEDGSIEWRHPAGGVWTVPPGTAADLLPGLTDIVWDTPAPSPSPAPTPAPEDEATGEGLDDHARRRAAQRRRQRKLNCKRRLARKQQRAEHSEKMAQEIERKRAEEQGIEYVPRTEPEPSPY